MLKHRINKALREINKPASDLISFLTITQPGYYLMLRNDDMKVSLLKKIAKFLDKPINYFTDESEPKPYSTVNESDNTNSNQALENKLLHSRVADLERIVEFQDQEIKEYQQKEKTKQPKEKREKAKH